MANRVTFVGLGGRSLQLPLDPSLRRNPSTKNPPRKLYISTHLEYVNARAQAKTVDARTRFGRQFWKYCNLPRTGFQKCSKCSMQSEAVHLPKAILMTAMRRSFNLSIPQPLRWRRRSFLERTRATVKACKQQKRKRDQQCISHTLPHDKPEHDFLQISWINATGEIDTSVLPCRVFYSTPLTYSKMGGGRKLVTGLGTTEFSPYAKQLVWPGVVLKKRLDVRLDFWKNGDWCRDTCFLGTTNMYVM